MDANLVKVNGVVSMDKSFDFLCSLLRNGEYVVSIKRKTKPRTISQNNLMWMWFKCMEDATGQPKEDWHDYYASKFLVKVVDIGPRQYSVVGGTKKLTTVQFTEFLQKVQADAAAEYGITLPLPEDLSFQPFVTEYRSRTEFHD